MSGQVGRLLQMPSVGDNQHAPDPVTRDFHNCLLTYLSLSSENFDTHKNIQVHYLLLLLLFCQLIITATF